MTKPRVLIVTEATFLNTGYSIYGRNLIERFVRDGYDVTELGVYSEDKQHRSKDIKWKFIPNHPGLGGNFTSDTSNFYGKFVFNDAIINYKPHILIDFRDPFMYDFAWYSPLRGKYHFCALAPVDGYHQQEQWLEIFNDADSLLTYTNWAKNLLESNNIKVDGIASPAASEKYFQADSKTIQAMKNTFGLGEYKIVGNIMRNQERKLFDSLFIGFKKYLEKTGDNKTLLYLHTSYPDVGFDISKMIFEHKLSSKVLMTYICKACKACYPSFFIDTIGYCNVCGNKSLRTVDVYDSASEENLNKIMNLFDVYVQMAGREGFGMPQVEAAACGIPIITLPYAGMNDIVEKLITFPVKVSEDRLNVQMHMYECVPDTDDLASKLEHVLNLKFDKSLQRKAFEDKYHSYESTYNVYKNIVDSVDIEKIEENSKKMIEVQNPDKYMDLPIPEFVNYLIKNVLKEPRFLGGILHARLLRDLDQGVTFTNPNYYIVEHFVGKNPHAFNKQKAYEIMKDMCLQNNYWKNKWNESINNRTL